MPQTFLHRVIALVLTALILAAHAPLPRAASKMACCGPAACCRPERSCTTGGACATHPGHAAGAPIHRAQPTLLAGNCGDPTPRIAPVSYDPGTEPARTTVRVEAATTTFAAAPTPAAPARDTTPSVPPPRA